MFNIRKEGEPLLNGFNFYSINDKNNFGFLFRYGEKIPLGNTGSKCFSFRYSKVSKKWFIKNRTLAKLDGDDNETSS